MRIFVDPVEMYKEVQRDLFEMGTRYQTATVQDKDVAGDRNFQTIELFGYCYQLHDATSQGLDEMLRISNVDKVWAHAEAIERLKPNIWGEIHDRRNVLNPGTAWELRKDLWEPFLRDGVFSYSYAERWWEQIPYIVRELRKRPNTRQAVMTMYDRHQDMMNWGGRDRVPCSLTYQFMIRDRALHVVYNQRSCDFVKFFTADVFFTWRLMTAIARTIEIEIGTLTHFLGSLHAFAGDLKDKDIF